LYFADSFWLYCKALTFGDVLFQTAGCFSLLTLPLSVFLQLSFIFFYSQQPTSMKYVILEAFNCTSPFFHIVQWTDICVTTND
jgi:hypothetical protein